MNLEKRLTKSKFAVSDRSGSINGLKGNTDNLFEDGALVEETVSDCRYLILILDSALSQISRTDTGTSLVEPINEQKSILPENTVNTSESRRTGSNADGLLCDHKS